MTKSPNALVDQLVGDFAMFVDERTSNIDIERERIIAAKMFLTDSAVAPHPYSVKIRFLKFKGFSTSEIEGALEEVNPRVLMALIDGTDVDAAAAGPNNNNTNSNATVNGSNYFDRTEGGFSSGSGAQQAEEAALLRVRDEDVADANLWKVGASVFVYRGNHLYTPTKIAAIDLSRGGDILGVRLSYPGARLEHDPVRFYPPGFKGVVPDEYAPHALLQVGSTVIYEEEETRNTKMTCREAVVLAKTDPEGREGMYVVDLELSGFETPVVAKGVDYRSVRMVTHPKVAQWDREQQDTVKMKYQVNTDRIISSGVFPAGPISHRFLSDPNTPEHCKITTFIKNFMKYPKCFTYDKLRNFRDGNAFVSQFGEIRGDKGNKEFPRLPPCQSEQNGIGFEFNLSIFERHPESSAYFLTNPLIEVALQCVKRDSMFVDPDFPPSVASLIGVDNLNNGGDAPPNITWRRLGEILHAPTVRSVESKPMEFYSGYFTPSWIVNVFTALDGTGEIEDIVSPLEDGGLYGAYVVRLFVDGFWAFVLVDDFVPCAEDTGMPITTTSGNPNEIYPILVEKALAKISGGYYALRYPSRGSGTVLEKVWEDVSSSVTDIVDHRDDMIVKESTHANLQACVNNSSNSARVFAAGRAGGKFKDVGIFEGECWLVNHVSQYLAPGKRLSEQQYFYHVTKPTNLSDSIPNMTRTRERMLSALPYAAVETFPDLDSHQPLGVTSFWLSDEDFFRAFSKTISFWHFNNTQRATILGGFEGYAGCSGKMDGVTKWLANPQYYVSFVQPSDVIIELKLLDRRLRKGKRIDGRRLQLHILKGPPLESRVTHADDYVAASPMIDLHYDDDGVSGGLMVGSAGGKAGAARRHKAASAGGGGSVPSLGDGGSSLDHPSAVIRTSIPGGNYILVPSIGGESTEEFALKIVSVSAFYVKVLPRHNAATTTTATANATAPTASILHYPAAVGGSSMNTAAGGATALMDMTL